VGASSLNYRDLMVLKGGGRGPTKLGVVPLSDGAGEVAAMGDGVTRVKLGDRIIGAFHRGGSATIERGLSDRPAWRQPRRDAVGIRCVERGSSRACAEPPLLRGGGDPACAAVTAWVALTGHRRVTAGDTVLTQGSGGVSVFALQFAQVSGARMIATTSTRKRPKSSRRWGLRGDQLHRDARLGREARGLTDGRGVDCVVEIGGPGTIAKSLKLWPSAGMSA